MRLRHILPTALLVISALFVAGGASADPAGAQTWVETEHGNIRKLVDTNASSDDVRTAINKMVDFTELTNRTLGNPCAIQVPNCTNIKDKVSKEQFDKINELLAKLVEKNYHKNLNKTKDYEITYRGAKEASDNLAKVRTEAKNKTKPRDPAVQVDYIVIEKNGRYYVIDIVTEGSSMVKNYYDQFYKMLVTNADTQGPAYLIQKLEKKLSAPAKEATEAKE
jgi:phospholipid transport system substrate-binding protein